MLGGDGPLLATPSLAVDHARFELSRLFDRVGQMLHDLLPAILGGERDALAAIEQQDDEVDTLYGHIISYPGRISEQTLRDARTTELLYRIAIANATESMGDVIETDLVGSGRELLRTGVRISPATAKVIEQFHAEVSNALGFTRIAVIARDPEAASRVVVLGDEAGEDS